MYVVLSLHLVYLYGRSASGLGVPVHQLHFEVVIRPWECILWVHCICFLVSDSSTIMSFTFYFEGGGGWLKTPTNNLFRNFTLTGKLKNYPLKLTWVHKYSITFWPEWLACAVTELCVHY